MATTTNDTTVVSLRLPTELTQQLDELAAWMERSRSWLALRAIQEYVEREYSVMSEVMAGDKDIAEGRTVSLDQVRPWLQQLAGGKFSPPPQSRRRRK